MKLVRNRIPQIIEQSGFAPRCHVADLPEFITRLEDKMKEELQEFMDEPSKEEAADMYEVLRCLCWLHKIDMADVFVAAGLKREARGSFSRGVVLETTEEREIDDDWTTTSQGEQV